MAMETCSGCGIRFAAGLLRCPRCWAVAPLYASRVTNELPPREEAPAAVSTLRGEHGPELAVPAAGAHVDLTFKQLRTMAKARSLPASGTTAELTARIAEHDAAKAGA